MSVGHIARALEEAGISTVIIATKAFRPRLEAINAPRLVFTPYPMGRPLGAPHDIEGQRTTLLAALNLLEHAPSTQSIIELDHPYQPGQNKKF